MRETLREIIGFPYDPFFFIKWSVKCFTPFSLQTMVLNVYNKYIQ